MAHDHQTLPAENDNLTAADRRRPGRIENPHPNLIAVLRAPTADPPPGAFMDSLLSDKPPTPHIPFAIVLLAALAFWSLVALLAVLL